MIKNKKLAISGLSVFILLVVTLLLGVALGSVNLSLERLAGAFTGEDRTAQIIIFDLRLPRVIAAAFAGAGLATAGYILQTLTDNDLCAPNIIGVNSGAGLAVMITLCIFPGMWRALPFTAFVGALSATAIVLGIYFFGAGGRQRSALVLSGVAVSSLMSAGISFLSLRYPDVLSSYTAFSVGGVSGVSFDDIMIPGAVIILCFFVTLFIAPRLSLLCLGDEHAASLGVRVLRLRMIAAIISSALCAAVVSFAGLLGFVGLVVPHIVRGLIGGSVRQNLPFCAMCGGILVILSDLAGRCFFSPGELPAGIIMALIGAPFFLYLLIRGGRKYD